MLLKVNSIRNLHETITSNTIFSEIHTQEVKSKWYTQMQDT